MTQMGPENDLTLNSQCVSNDSYYGHWIIYSQDLKSEFREVFYNGHEFSWYFRFFRSMLMLGEGGVHQIRVQKNFLKRIGHFCES